VRSTAFAFAAFVLMLSSACTPKVVKVDMDTARLATIGATDERLRCGYRLGDVVDMRPSGDRAGGLGFRMFQFEDAPGVIRSSLSNVGFLEDAASRRVEVRLMRLYMNQVNVTKIPVVVYEVQVDGQAPALIRSQLPGMNWNGTENEAYRGYGQALEGANRQLVQTLNRACG
jgi:hypothetical protein